MEQLKYYGEYLYNFSRIPIYLYRDDTLIACFPEQSDLFHPPIQYLHSMQSNMELISYFCTPLHNYFGMVRIQSENSYFVLGPVQPVDFNDRILSEMCKEYVVPLEQHEEFYNFYQFIPRTTVNTLLDLLLLVNHTLNKSMLSQKNLPEFQTGNSSSSNIKSAETNSFYHLKENEHLYNNHTIEEELIECIKNGNVKKLESFSAKAHQASRYGEVAKDNLRQAKNTFIIAATIVSRAAIAGGLPAGIAHSLSDIYMQQMEQLHDIPSVLALTHTLQQDFCSRVSENKANSQCDDIISKAIEYIHQNTNKPVKTDDIAYAIGLSRTYLSRKFKQDLGFNLSDFIRRCKLEEGRNLLLYTDKSISQISAYLCFSSQGHFHALFKKQFGMTPLQCRRQGEINVP